jgi:TPR repeat protein
MECIICLTERNKKDFIKLSCNHDLCLICSYKIIESNNQSCPFCRKNYNLFELIYITAHFNDSYSQLQLGKFYDQKSEYKNAFKWYIKSAKHGNFDAYYYIGIMRVIGKGTKQSLRRGLKTLTKAANKNNIKSLIALAEIYYHGKYTTVNFNKSFEYYYQSAILGSRSAGKMISVMYNKGRGVPRNKVLANKWKMISTKEEMVNIEEIINQLYLEL